MSLIPGGQAMWDNLQRSGAVQRAAEWFSAELPKLGLTWEAIRGLFSRAWAALGVTDLLNPARAWQRIVGIFGPPLRRLRDFAVAAGSKVLEFIFEGVLSLAGSLGPQVMAIIRRAGGVLTTIFRNPIGFAGKLIAAVRGGLGRFMANIATHLRSGLFAWLTGALRGAVALPARLDWRGILGFILSILGLTWASLRARLIRLIGEPRVAWLERAVHWVQAIVTGGLGAIADRILSFATGLIDTVIGGIRDWVARSVVGAAITRLITMFNPAGAVIQAILAVYNTIRFFIERAQQLGALAPSVFGSITAIASGNIGNAITAVEQAMARALPVVLGFLARLIGLGDIAEPVRGVINRARGFIDAALDRVVGWLAGMARRIRGGPERGRGPERNQAASLQAMLRRLTRRRPVTIMGESHQMYLARRGNTYDVMLASADADWLLSKIALAENHELVKQCPGTMAQLRGLRNKLEHLKNEVATALGLPSRQQINAAEANLADECGKITVILGRIGTKFNIATLKGTVWTVDGRIRPAIQIRKTFYGPESAYRRHRGNLMGEQIQKKRDEVHIWGSHPMYNRGTYVCPGAMRGHTTIRPHLHSQEDGEVDHKIPVTTHWEREGRKGNHADRVEWYGDPENLQILCGKCNRMKGSGGEKFNRKVEAGFTGPDGNP